MIWVSGIIVVLFIIMLIWQKPKLSVFIGIVLFIIYLNADKDYENPRNKEVQIEDSNIQKINFSDSYNINNSNSDLTSKQKKNIFDQFEKEHDKETNAYEYDYDYDEENHDYEYDYDNYDYDYDKENHAYEYNYETKNKTYYKSNQEVERVRIGAICNDGTTSKATGSGACSHHGGVAVWLYE